MSAYLTKYSNLNDFSKKERKVKIAQFPYTAPNSNLSSVDWCGQKVSKTEIGSNVKFCPLCDIPMIVRMMIVPCEHVICYSCSKPDSDICYVCEGKVMNIIRISDKAKLYDCDFPDCFRCYESLDKLNMHKYSIHGIPVFMDPNMMKQQDQMNMMPMNMGSMPRFPGMMNPMMMPQMGGMGMPVQMGFSQMDNNLNI